MARKEGKTTRLQEDTRSACQTTEIIHVQHNVCFCKTILTGKLPETLHIALSSAEMANVDFCNQPHLCIGAHGAMDTLRWRLAQLSGRLSANRRLLRGCSDPKRSKLSESKCTEYEAAIPAQLPPVARSFAFPGWGAVFFVSFPKSSGNPAVCCISRFFGGSRLRSQ